MHYAAIGASDAVGVGSSVVCFPNTDCANGTSYVYVLARRLAEGRQLTLTNLGIPAAVIGPDIQQLGQRYGRSTPANFIEHEAPRIPATATLVTIFAGGNDTNAIAAAVAAGAGGSDLTGYIDTQVRAFANDYVTLVDALRQRAPSARIVVANLPNFAAVPFTAGYTLMQRQIMQKISVGVSTVGTNALVSRGVTVVDLLCDARAYNAENFSSDGFHPNDIGYAYLADVLFSAINAASYPAPAPSCPQMTLVPAL